MTRRTRDIFFLMAAVVSINSLLWLDSFDRYLNSRYHIYLSAYLPEPAFTPSRNLQRVLGLDDKNEQTAAADDSGPPDNAAAVKPQVVISQIAAASQAAAASEPVAAVELVAASQPTAASQPPTASELALAQAASGHEERHKGALPVEHPKVLFAGDSMMQGVAPFVISHLRKEYPHGVFVDLSKPSTGLTVKRYFDWPTKIKEETIKQAFQVVVIFLGPNDPWDIYEAKKHYPFPSDRWTEKYRARVDEVLDFRRVARSARHLGWAARDARRTDQARGQDREPDISGRDQEVSLRLPVHRGIFRKPG